jgi:hypothetical protein
LSASISAFLLFTGNAFSSTTDLDCILVSLWDSSSHPLRLLIAAILALINQAEHIYELEPIPTVGKAAAAAILQNRPDGGYTSLDDLAPILPRQSKLDEIKSWGGVDADPA